MYETKEYAAKTENFIEGFVDIIEYGGHQSEIKEINNNGNKANQLIGSLPV